MSILKQVRIPAINANDDSVKLFWEVSSGAYVKPGQVIAQVETTKVVADLHAESEGYIILLDERENGVPVDQLVAVIADSPDADLASEIDLGKAGEEKHTKKTGWTKKAEWTAKRLGIEIERLSEEHGFIDEAKLKQILEARSQGVQDLRLNVGDMLQDVYPAGETKRVLLIGNGYGSALILDAMRRIPSKRAMGILDDNVKKHGVRQYGVPVLGATEMAFSLWEEGQFDEALVVIHGVPEVRKRIFEELKEKGVPFGNLIEPGVEIATQVTLGEGNIILGRSRIGACSRIGNNNVLRCNVFLDHFNRVGDYNSFGPGVTTSGSVSIGDMVKFGTGIFIEPGLSIGSYSTIGSGAVLTQSIPESSQVKTRQNYLITKKS